MAQKRMFSLTVTDTDTFLDMPTSTQALYFHLGMHGDDDGFVGSPKKIMRGAGCAADDMKLLISKGFIIPFDSGVVVIRDWRINNDLKNDRYHETIYTEEKAQITTDPSKRYALVSSMDTSCTQYVSSLETEHNITEHNITESSKESAAKPPRARFIPPSVEEVAAYCQERHSDIDPQRFVDYYTANGWTQGRGKPIKDWKAAVRTWERIPRNDQPPPQEPDWRLSIPNRSGGAPKSAKGEQKQ